jgi:negative regulator of sigma-B (phosphoserine phosphatase)
VTSLVTSTLTRPKIGEIESGDVAVVRRDGDRVLCAVIDALGHGPVAAAVAGLAAGALLADAFSGDVAKLLLATDRVLKGTRGAAGLLCVFDGASSSLSAAAVGNVEMVTSSRTISVRAQPGIIGSLTRPPRAFRSTMYPGDRIAIISDGVSQRFSLADTSALSRDQACRTIFEAHARDHDDATLLLAEVTP